MMNTINETISEAFDNTISRDGTGPNQMEANLDMNGYRIINTAAPTLGTDLVRLQDLSSITVEGATETPEQILEKVKLVDGPGSGLDADTVDGLQAAVFVRSVNGALPDGNGAISVGGVSTEEVEDIIGSSILAGDNVTVVYNDPSGKTTINATVPTWSSLAGKPSTFEPIVESVEDLIGMSIVAGTNITATYNDTTGKTTIAASGAVSTDWASITSKPATFEPTVESVQDIVGSLIVAGTNITANYNDVANTLTLSATGSVATDWSSVTGKPTTFEPIVESVQDIVGAQIVAGSNITTSYNDVAGTLTINSTSGGVSTNTIIPLESFGTVTRDGTTDNATTFAAAVSASARNVWQGGKGNQVIYANAPWTNYRNINYKDGAKFKFRWGPGALEYDTFPPNFIALNTKPTQALSVDRPYDGSDLSYSNATYFRLDDGVDRRSWTSTYYEPTVTPNWLDIVGSWKSGDSGATSWVNTAFSGTTCTIHTANTTHASLTTDALKTGFANGDSIKFFDPNTDAILHTTTVVSVSGSTLTIAGAPSATIPVGTRIAHSYRTMNTGQYTIVNTAGGGDHYLNMGRMFVNYKARSGQRHVFQTATGALFGGELHGLSDGLWLTGIEINQINDNGFDMGASCPFNFHRTNNTAGRFAYWNGIAMTNAGIDGRSAVPMDNWLSFNGPCRVGIDMALGVTTFTEAFLGTKIGMDWHMDRTVVSRVQNGYTNPYPEGYSTNSYDPARTGITSFGFQETDGRGVRIRTRVNGNEVLNIRGSAVEATKPVRSGSSTGMTNYVEMDGTANPRIAFVTGGNGNNYIERASNNTIIGAGGAAMLTVGPSSLTMGGPLTIAGSIGATSASFSSTLNATGKITSSGEVQGQYLRCQSGTGTRSHIIYFGDQGSGASYMVIDTAGGAGALYINGVAKLTF